MLGWVSASGVLMLWGFFDESGEHAPQNEGGQLIRLTLGGCWASFQQWEAFSLDWAAALDAFDIRVFHMTDFEANQGEFKGWRDRLDDRRRLLNSLLDAIINHVPEFVGFSESTPNGDIDFKRIYESNIVSMLSNSSFQHQPSIVVARHNDYGPSKIGELVEAAERAFQHMGWSVKTWTVGDPAEFCPLQAADLIAYEIARHDREKELRRPMRYPLRRLREKASSALGIMW
jgi:hypothetical protein